MSKNSKKKLSLSNKLRLFWEQNKDKMTIEQMSHIFVINNCKKYKQNSIT